MFSKKGYYAITMLLLYGMSVVMLFLATLDVIEVSKMQRHSHTVDCDALYFEIGTDTDADSFDRACPNYFGQEDQAKLTYLGGDL